MGGDRPAGILPAHRIVALAEAGGIVAPRPFDADQVQPASLDLRLGPVAYRVRASFLPGPNATVAERVASLTLHEIDLTKGALLEPGRSGVYIVPLMERLALPRRHCRRDQPEILDRPARCLHPRHRRPRPRVRHDSRRATTARSMSRSARGRSR